MAEMRDPAEFSKSLYFANALITGTYVLTALVCFALGGRGVDAFILFSVPPGAARLTATVALAVHILGAFIVGAAPLLTQVHQWLSPRTAHVPGWEGQRNHFLISAILLAAGYTFGQAVPFFKDLQGLIAALFASPIIFFFPAWFFRCSAAARGEPLGGLDRAFVAASIGLLLPVCGVLGLATALRGLAQGWAARGGVFACDVPQSAGD